MRWEGFAVLCLLAACETPLVDVSADFDAPASLDFGATALGDVRQRGLTVQNRTRRNLELELAAPPPFTIEGKRVVPAGGTLELELSFVPSSLGPAQASLRLLAEDLVREVTLRGEGVAPAVCVSAPCRRSERDPATNTCIESPLGDGATCVPDNACLAQGRCLAGVCVGAAPSCDDGNACTVDACEPVGGCLHFEKVCPPPADPCFVAACDSSSGCSTVLATDGTPCGPSDCASAQVCIAGQCKTLAVPEGYACGEVSPCRPKGRCVQGSCNQPPAHPLVEAWSVTLGSDLDFRGVADPMGNLYWVECRPILGGFPCELVSYTSWGQRRFGAGTVGVTASETSHLWSAGQVVVASRSGELSVHSYLTGTMLWSQTRGQGVQLRALGADHRGQLYVVEVTEGESQPWSLRVMSAATGSVLRSFSLGGPVSGLVLDSQDNVYFEVSGTTAPLVAASSAGPSAGAGAFNHVLSLAPDGAVRFVQALGEQAAPVATFNGELLMDTKDLRSTVNGGLIAAGENPGFGTVLALAPLMSLGFRYEWRQLGCCPSCKCDALGPYLPQVQLEGRADAQSSRRFSYNASGPDHPPQVSQPLLLSSGSALFASHRSGENVVALREVDSLGKERFSCELGPASSSGEVHFWTGATVLAQGRWAVVEQVACPSCLRAPDPILRVYETPGLSLSSVGWVSAGGELGRAAGSRTSP